MAPFVLVVHNPERAVGFVFDDNEICIGVTTGTTDRYLGKDLNYIKGAMYSVLRFEDGTEPQPNTGHSANGYPAMDIVGWKSPWKKIASAPRDKKILVALVQDGRIYRVSEATFYSFAFYDTAGKNCHWATHWMLLPEGCE